MKNSSTELTEDPREKQQHPKRCYKGEYHAYYHNSHTTFLSKERLVLRVVWTLSEDTEISVTVLTHPLILHHKIIKISLFVIHKARSLYTALRSQYGKRLTHDIFNMSHHDTAFTLLIFPSIETWQHRASAFPILSTSLATAATISYTHCSPPYPNSFLLLHSFCHSFMTIVAKAFSFNSGFYCHMGQIGQTVECIFSVQYDPFQNTTTTIVMSDVPKKKVIH